MGLLKLRQTASIVAVASSLVIFAFLLSYPLAASVRFPNNSAAAFAHIGAPSERTGTLAAAPAAAAAPKV